jgi:hypothetical protein
MRNDALRAVEGYGQQTTACFIKGSASRAMLRNEWQDTSIANPNPHRCSRRRGHADRRREQSDRMQQEVQLSPLLGICSKTFSS